MIEYKVDQWFVRVEPEQGYREDIEREKKTCQGIIDDIRRHVDCVDQVYLDNEGHYECSFCHCTNANKDDYECCEESIAEHENLVAKGKEQTE